MKFIFRLTKSNRLTLPYILNRLATLRVPEENVFLRESVEEILQIFHSLTAQQRARTIVFYSFMTPHIKWVYEEVRMIRQTFPDIVLIAGGPHTTGDPISSLKMGFHIAFAGDSEKSFPEFIGWIEDHWLRQKRPAIYYAEPVASIDDSFPMNPYFFFYPPLEITRGCYWHCKFCQTSTRHAVHRSFDSIQMYIRELKKVGFLSRIGFICPSASEYGADSVKQLRLDRIEQLLSYLKKEGARYIEYGIFPSETRPNQITSDFLDIVKTYCSNKKITIGAQVASDPLLRKLRRGHLIEHIYRATELVASKGFQPLLDFIIGFPGETVEERMETFAIMKDLSRKYKARMQMHYFLPLSGTPLAKNLPTLLDEKSKEILDHYHRSGIASSWWREGMRRSWDLVDTMKELENVVIEDYQVVHAGKHVSDVLSTSRTTF